MNTPRSVFPELSAGTTIGPIVGDPGWRNRAGRVAWGLARWLLVCWTPRRAHGWRALVLRSFGARLGPRCHIYPGARIWAPWNLVCGADVAIADGAVVYNAAPVRLGDGCVISQQALLCAAGHDVDDPTFPMVARPIEIGARAWIGARASVAAGVRVGDGAVLGMCSLATRDLAPWTVHVGVPARALRPRRRFDSAGASAGAC